MKLFEYLTTLDVRSNAVASQASEFRTKSIFFQPHWLSLRFSPYGVWPGAIALYHMNKFHLCHFISY